MTQRGGKREGAGRPPLFFSESDSFRLALVKAERESVQSGQKSMADVLVEMAKSSDKRTAVQAQRIFWSIVVVPVAEKPHDIERPQGPIIYDHTDPESRESAERYVKAIGGGICLPATRPPETSENVVPLDSSKKGEQQETD